MNDLQQFTSAQFGDIRALSIDGEPWFVGKDIAERLGYTNPLKAIRDHVDPEDKGVNEMDTPGGRQPWETGKTKPCKKHRNRLRAALHVTEEQLKKELE